MKSKVENLLDAIITQLKTVKKKNGYRTDIQLVTRRMIDITKQTAFPAVCMLVPSEKFRPDDSNWRLITSKVKVTLLGFVSSATRTDEALLAEAQENLIHDLKRALAAVATENANAETGKWIIDYRDEAFTIGRDWDYTNNKAMIAISFVASSQYQDATYF